MEREEICAEVHFAQTLASNEKKIRDRALKRLYKYLSVRSNQSCLSYDDLLKIWKGLHYCMWMQDKPLIQEELSQRMARLLHAFPSLNGSVNFLKVFLVTLAREWNGIDSFRLDKFMMLCRDMVHEGLLMLSQAGWPTEECCALARSLVESVMQPNASHLSDGLRLHLASVFMEELRKMPLVEMSSTKLIVLLAPFINFILYSDKLETVKRIMSSTILEAWKNMSNDHKSSNKKKSSSKKKKNLHQDSEDDEEMEADDEDEEDRMEVEEKHNAPKGPQKFELREMFLVMFRLAEKKKVHTSNRKLIYSLIKGKPGLNQDIQSSSTNSDSLNSLLGLVLSVNNSKSLSLLQSDGKTSSPGQEGTEEKRKKKRRRKNRKQDAEKTSEQAMDESGDAPAAVSLEVAQGEGRKKKEKKKMLKEDGEMKENEDEHVGDDGLVKTGRKSNKKRKRSVSEGEDGPSVDAKKVKLAAGVDKDAEETPVKTGMKKKKIKRRLEQQAKSLGDNQSAERDKNSNARKRPCSPGTNIPASPMEIVTYPSSVKASHPKKTQPQSLPADSVADHLEESSTFSPAVGEAPPSGKRKKSQLGATEAEPGRDGGTGEAGSASGGKSILGEFCTAITSPGDLMKKAIAMVTPSGQGETDQEKTPGSAMTPGSKKKVVFNLRKNKANKFKDYLKSLATQPSSPYEPTKSPSQSILKSPAVSPPLSDTDNSSDTNTEDSPKRRKSRSQLKDQGSSASKKRNNSGKRKKRNSSPRPSRKPASPSPSPSNARHKQRSRLKS